MLLTLLGEEAEGAGGDPLGACVPVESGIWEHGLWSWEGGSNLPRLALWLWLVNLSMPCFLHL